MVPEIPEERGPLLDRTGAGLSYTPDSQPPTTMEKQGLERTPVTPEKGESFSCHPQYSTKDNYEIVKIH